MAWLCLFIKVSQPDVSVSDDSEKKILALQLLASLKYKYKYKDFRKPAMPQPAGNVACLHQTDSIDADCDPYQEEY